MQVFVVSISYDDIPVPGREIGRFPILERQPRSPAFTPLASRFPYNLSMQATSLASFVPAAERPLQLRPLTLTPGFVQTAEGSVLVSLGNTRVLTNATVEQGVPGWLRNSGPRLGDGRVLHAAPLHRDPDSARERDGARSAAGRTRFSG